MARIFWAGDSTVKQNSILTYPQTGIGQILPLFLQPEVQLKNHAENGRSTKSFIDESRLAEIYHHITKEDFLFIQFGHNDQKIDDPQRYTEPFGEYQENLRKFIHVAQNKGAYPVLITPLERRSFTNGLQDQSSHTEYVAAMKQVSVEDGVPLIDLQKKSRMQLTAAGAEKSKSWYMNLLPAIYENYPDGKEDNTHLQYQGAVIFAACIANGLDELGGIYQKLLIPEIRQTQEQWLRFLV